MSDLQRRIQQAAAAAKKGSSGVTSPESKSRPTSRSGSRQNSKPGSRSSSRLGSRFHSDDEDDYTTNNNNVDLLSQADELATSLSQLQSDEEGEVKGSGGKPKDKFAECIEILENDRRTSSLEAREGALLLILSDITQKYDPNKISDKLMDLLVKAYKNSRSDLESMLSLQALCIVSACEDSEIDLEQITDILPKIWSFITHKQGTENSVKTNMVYSYCLLQYFMLFGSGAFNVDSIIDDLMEFAEGLTSDEAPVISAALISTGLLTSIMPNPNSVIDQYLPSFIDFLENPSTDVKLAAGKVIALYFQIYNYKEKLDEDDSEGTDDDEGERNHIQFIDYHDLYATLKELASQSSKKLGKKDKREQKSLFKDVIKTIEHFSSKSSRRSLTSEDLIITHLRLSRSKSLSVDSWNKLLLIQMYKWLYGPGIHTHIANNSFIQETVKASSYELAPDTFDTSDLRETVANVDTESKEGHKLSAVARSKKIRAERERKVLQQMS
jgi:hypothetical protein